MTMPLMASAQRGSVLKYVPYTDVTVLDPIWTTAYVTRDHAAMVYDTPFGMDADYRPQHEMLEGHQVSDDGLRWTLRLRGGLPCRGRRGEGHAGPGRQKRRKAIAADRDGGVPGRWQLRRQRAEFPG